ncbi:unnamed protein product [Protopolystoma xenopodis]|uniref:Peptidase S8/S53 domain-containing protein n=1 Tax=Protopolystoma xenopodis TaxID=117903 RepID=A0A3S5BYI1_9PLAT|nr:unnamed protein product [Protopolystoma xenopodis]
MLDGIVTDILEARSITYEASSVDIFSASWGPSDDGATIDLPRHYLQRAFIHGAVTVSLRTRSCIDWLH